MTSQNEQMQATVTQQLSQIQQHKDQYNILKLKLGGFTSGLLAVSSRKYPLTSLALVFISSDNVSFYDNVLLFHC